MTIVTNINSLISSQCSLVSLTKFISFYDFFLNFSVFFRRIKVDGWEKSIKIYELLAYTKIFFSFISCHSVHTKASPDPFSDNDICFWDYYHVFVFNLTVPQTFPSFRIFKCTKFRLNSCVN